MTIQSTKTCQRIIQHTEKDLGKTYKSICNKPTFKDNLCKSHYQQQFKKRINWEHRDNYRPATIDDFYNHVTLKLNGTNTNILYKYSNIGMLKYNKTENKYLLDTNASLNVTDYSVKVY